MNSQKINLLCVAEGTRLFSDTSVLVGVACLPPHTDGLTRRVKGLPTGRLTPDSAEIGPERRFKGMRFDWTGASTRVPGRFGGLEALATEGDAERPCKELKRIGCLAFYD